MALTAPERSVFTALPDPGQVVDERLWCELEADHAGLHYSLGQTSGEAWWWLRWGPERRELVEVGPCGQIGVAQTSADQDPTEMVEVECSLPAEHPGLHGFELGTDC